MENIEAIIEALILSSESPLTLDKICAVLDGLDKTEVREALDRLMAGYEARQSGISVQEVAGGFQFRTRPEMSAWVKKLKGAKPASLSPASLETLAIVAYRQPIVKAEIESIRGVDVSAPLKGLLDKKLIRIVGRKDVPGKPIIYGTTKRFLEVFNLKELADLPTMRELKELTENQEIFDEETTADTRDGETTELESSTREIFDQETAADNAADRETSQQESSVQDTLLPETMAGEARGQETPEQAPAPEKALVPETAADNAAGRETSQQESAAQDTLLPETITDEARGLETPERESSARETVEDEQNS
ncbi:MAG: SMC-Scp complex subunit ScpB [Deltaproteobacteria bacterium]